MPLRRRTTPHRLTTRPLTQIPTQRFLSDTLPLLVTITSTIVTVLPRSRSCPRRMGIMLRLSLPTSQQCIVHNMRHRQPRRLFRPSLTSRFLRHTVINNTMEPRRLMVVRTRPRPTQQRVLRHLILCTRRCRLVPHTHQIQTPLLTEPLDLIPMVRRFPPRQPTPQLRCRGFKGIPQMPRFPVVQWRM